MRRYYLPLVFIAAICIASCARQPEEQTDQVRTVTFNTKDGVKVFGDYYHQTKPAPLVILLHMYGRNRSTWDYFAPLLYKQGFAVLALDMRGHGESVEQNGKRIRLNYQKKGEPNIFLDTWRDVEAALEFMKQYPTCKTDALLIVGASIGCSVALHAGTKLPQIKGAVLMSPGVNYMGVNSIEHIKEFAPRPLLMFSDEKEAPACDALIKAGGYDASIHRTFPEAGHGTLMFESPENEKIAQAIIDWLKTHSE